MAKVYVSTSKQTRVFSTIDLTSVEWAALHINNLVPFNVEEAKRQCKAYPDGIFPGGTSNGENKQMTKIYNFANAIEFSKIVTDEVEKIDGKSYLTTKYYNRRKQGWGTRETLKKDGTVIGYCIDGDVYTPISDAALEKIFVKIMLHPLIKKKPVYQRLIDFLNDGICLILTGATEKYLKQLADVLTIQ